MNLLRLGYSSLIVIIIIVLSIILIIQMSYNERFINYPQQVDPSKTINSDPEAQQANTAYAVVLMYIQKNPSKSTKFIRDIQHKFFNDSCSVKDIIDFNNIAQLPNGVPFT